MQIETNGHSIGLGRFDQTMYPYYKRDLEKGIITFEQCVEMIQQGLATPAMFNDNLVIPTVLAKGATIQEARDWSIEGCVENYVTGKTDGRPEIARRIVEIAADEIDKYPDSRNGRYVLSVLSQSFNVLQGKSVAATPDGRYAFTPLSNNASPCAGRDKNGPTAALHSVSKIDQFRPLIGTLLNQKFDPAFVSGDKGLEVLGMVVKSYFDQYGEHVQINVVDEATLRDAQKNPANHRNLMVRVAGYSAYFIELDKDVQEDVIARTTQTRL